MNRLKGWLNLFWEYGNSGIKPRYIPKQKYTYGERVEVQNADDSHWIEATFVHHSEVGVYWTKEDGQKPRHWDRIRKIDPYKK